MSVRDGEVVLVFGGNGSGKTTLLKVIADLLKPQVCVIRVLGREVNGTSLKLVGLSSQNPLHQFCFGSVDEEELKASLRFNGYVDIKDKVNEVLELFNLKHLRHRSPFTLSSGEMRLFSIALVYIHDPSIMLLD